LVFWSRGGLLISCGCSRKENYGCWYS
jgi:hypothetical protein